MPSIDEALVLGIDLNKLSEDFNKAKALAENFLQTFAKPITVAQNLIDQSALTANVNKAVETVDRLAKAVGVVVSEITGVPPAMESVVGAIGGVAGAVTTQVEGAGKSLDKLQEKLAKAKDVIDDVTTQENTEAQSKRDKARIDRDKELESAQASRDAERAKDLQRLGAIRDQIDADILAKEKARIEAELEFERQSADLRVLIERNADTRIIELKRELAAKSVSLLLSRLADERAAQEQAVKLQKVNSAASAQELGIGSALPESAHTIKLKVDVEELKKGFKTQQDLLNKITDLEKEQGEDFKQVEKQKTKIAEVESGKRTSVSIENDKAELAAFEQSIVKRQQLLASLAQNQKDISSGITADAIKQLQVITNAPEGDLSESKKKARKLSEDNTKAEVEFGKRKTAILNSLDNQRAAFEDKLFRVRSHRAEFEARNVERLAGKGSAEQVKAAKLAHDTLLKFETDRENAVKVIRSRITDVSKATNLPDIRKGTQAFQILRNEATNTARATGREFKKTAADFGKLNSQGNLFQEISKGFEKNIGQSIGSVIKFQLAWRATGAIISAALLPVEAIAFGIQRGIQYLTEFEERAAQIREVLLQNAEVSGNVVDNFKAILPLTKATTEQLELNAAKLGASFATLQSAFEAFTQGGGLNLVQKEGDTLEDTLKRAVDTVTLLVAATASAGANLSDTRAFTRDIQKFVSETSTPADRLLKGLQLSSSEGRKLVASSRTVGDLFEKISVLAKNQKETLEQSNQRMSSLADLAGLFISKLAGKFAEPLFVRLESLLKDLNALFDDSGGTIGSVLKLLGGVPLGDVSGGVELLNQALGRTKKGIEDVNKARKDLVAEPFIGPNSGPVPIQDNELSFKRPKLNPEQAKEQVALIKTVLADGLNEIKNKESEFRERLQTLFSVGKISGRAKDQGLAGSFKRELTESKALLDDAKNNLKQGSVLEQAFDVTDAEKRKVTDDLNKQIRDITQQSTKGIEEASQEQAKRLENLRKEQSEFSIRQRVAEGKAQLEIFEQDAKQRLTLESDLIRKRRDQQVEDLNAEILIAERQRDLNAVGQPNANEENFQKFNNVVIDLQRRKREAIVLSEKQITQAIQAESLKRLEFFEEMAQRERDLRLELLQEEVADRIATNTQLLDLEIKNAEEERDAQLRINQQKIADARSGDAGGEAGPPEELFREQERIQKDFSTKILGLRKQRVRSAREEAEELRRLALEDLALQRDAIEQVIQLQEQGFVTDQQRIDNQLRLATVTNQLAEANLAEAEAELKNLEARGATNDAIIRQTQLVEQLTNAKIASDTGERAARNSAGRGRFAKFVDALVGRDTSNDDGSALRNALKAAIDRIKRKLENLQLPPTDVASLNKQLKELTKEFKRLTDESKKLKIAVALTKLEKAINTIAAGIENVVAGFQQDGALGGISAGLATAAALDTEPISKAILGIAATVTGLFGKLFTALARRLADQIRDAVDNITDQLNDGAITLGNAVAGLEAQRLRAIQELSGKKGGQKELDKLLPELDRQIKSLVKQQEDVRRSFEDELAQLRLGNDELADFATKWRDINAQVKEYLDSFAAGEDLINAQAQAAEFLSLKLGQIRQDALNDLADAEQQAIDDATELLDLFEQRKQLIEDMTKAQEEFNKAFFEAVNGAAIERRQSGAVKSGLEAARLTKEFETQKKASLERLTSLNQEIALKSQIVAKERTIFNLANDRAGLQRRSEALTLSNLDQMITKWRTLQSIANGIFQNPDGSFSLSPTLQNSVGAGSSITVGDINVTVNSGANILNPEQVGSEIADEIRRQSRMGFAIA